MFNNGDCHTGEEPFSGRTSNDILELSNNLICKCLTMDKCYVKVYVNRAEAKLNLSLSAAGAVFFI